MLVRESTFLALVYRKGEFLASHTLSIVAATILPLSFFRHFFVRDKEVAKKTRALSAHGRCCGQTSDPRATFLPLFKKVEKKKPALLEVDWWTNVLLGILAAWPLSGRSANNGNPRASRQSFLPTTSKSTRRCDPRA
jgi:hypothetical protein